MAKFEAHITFHRADRAIVKDIGEVHGWSYSAFDADPIMGDKPYCYLTAYDPNSFKLLDRMKSVAVACSALDVVILRQKIERIVYDTKTDVDELSPVTAGRD